MKKNELNDIDESNGILLDNIDKEQINLLHLAIKENFNNQSIEDKNRNILISIRFEMENYLNNNTVDKLITVGYFLQKIIDSLNIKSKILAEYLNLKPSNFTSLVKGNRKINIELALKLSYIFTEIHPYLWINIQSKNEIIKIQRKKIFNLKNYSLKDLLKMN